MAVSVEMCSVKRRSPRDDLLLAHGTSVFMRGFFCGNIFCVLRSLRTRSLLVAFLSTPARQHPLRNSDRVTISSAIGRLLERPKDLLGYNSTAQDAEIAPLSSRKQLGCSVYKHATFQNFKTPL